MEPETQTEQAPAPSVEDRIANIFGGEPKEAAQEEPTQPEETQAASEAEGETPEVAPAEETFEVEIDGEKFQLPKKLEKAVMQERDYTQKSQILAEQRRALELTQHQQRIAAMNEGFQREAGPELQQAQMLDEIIKQAQTQDVTGFDIDRLIRHRMDLDALKERRTALQQSIDAKRQEWGSKQAQEIAKLRAQSLETIQKRIPGWNEATAKEIRSHALSEGYTEEELNSILDPRHVQTLWKAQQFDKLKASAQKTVATAKTVKTTPSNPMPQHVKEKLAYRKDLQKVQRGSQQHQRLVQDRVAKIFGG
jgi:hypothetical protein